MSQTALAKQLEEIILDIAWGIKITREDVVKESQKAFAARLTAATGNKWDQSEVSDLETGKRKGIDITLLLVIAELQGRDFMWYLTEAPSLRRRLELRAIPGKAQGPVERAASEVSALSNLRELIAQSDKEDVPQYGMSPAEAA